jgi:DNA repair protein RecO
MDRFSTTGLVLAARDYRDRDRWVTILTPERGKIECLAKGVRTLASKRRPALLPGSLIRFSYVAKSEVNILTEAVLEHSLQLSDSTLERMRDLQAVLEILYHLSLENVEQTELYERGSALVRYIGETPDYHRGAIRSKLRELTLDQGFDVAEEDNDGVSVTALVEEFLGRKLHSFAFLRV